MVEHLFLGAFTEIDCWTHTATKLSTFSNIYANPVTAETIGRINRLISAWPQDDTLPAEGLDSVKTSYKKLASGLEEISKISEREVKSVYFSDRSRYFSKINISHQSD